MLDIIREDRLLRWLAVGRAGSRYYHGCVIYQSDS